jgi:hypothetical protein
MNGGDEGLRNVEGFLDNIERTQIVHFQDVDNLAQC